MAWEDQFKGILREVLEKGQNCHPHDPARELVAYQFTLLNPRDRLLRNPHAPFNLPQSLGQFIWMLRGDYEWEPMQFYTKSAERYTEDHRVMRGAYGFRFRGPGYLNQLDWIMEKKLTHEENQNARDSRRAIVSIYLPEFDQHEKKGAEVPCTALVQYLRRGDTLHAITYMRSQNAFLLLPVDIFLLSMLHEYVARSVGCDIGSYHHVCGSLHIYEKDVEKVRKAISDGSPPFDPMRDMPADVYGTMGSVANSERTIRQVANADWSAKTKELALLEERKFIASFPEYFKDYLTVI